MAKLKKIYNFENKIQNPLELRLVSTLMIDFLDKSTMTQLEHAWSLHHKPRQKAWIHV